MLLLFAVAAILSFLLSLTVKRLSTAARVLDMPDFRRKLNTVPVPRLGGVAFFLAFFISLALKSAYFGEVSATDVTLLCSGGLSLLFGAADDFFDLAPAQKLLFQALSAALVTVILPTPYPAFITIPLVILMMNAYNFIDGLDGLAAGLSLSSLLFFALVSVIFLHTGMGLTPILLFFALIGFLPLNAHPARLYMGEAGSSTLGLTLAVLTLSLPTPYSLLSLAFSLIPLFDAVSAVPRRLLRGRSPFAPDRGHLHHRLLSLGLSHPAAAGLLVSLSVILSITAILIAT